MLENDHIRRLLTAISLNGDQTAYRELFLLVHPRLQQFAYSILKSKEESEELVSDLFIKIWQKKDQLSAITQPLLYFYTSVKNLALNRLVKLKSQQNITAENWLVQLESIYFDPEKLMMTEEMIRQIRTAVNTLPPRCKLIFKLVKEDGLKYREVAELLNLSARTIEAQMAIALRRLGRCMHIDLKTGVKSTLA